MEYYKHKDKVLLLKEFHKICYPNSNIIEEEDIYLQHGESFSENSREEVERNSKIDEIIAFNQDNSNVESSPLPLMSKPSQESIKEDEDVNSPAEEVNWTFK